MSEIYPEAPVISVTPGQELFTRWRNAMEARGVGTDDWYDLGESDQESWEETAQPAAADYDHAADFLRYRATLERLADEDTPVLDEGLSGGAQEELHVRVNLARQALGLDVCGCTECMVSLGLEPDDDSARDALDAQTLHDSPGSDLDDEDPAEADEASYHAHRAAEADL